MKNLRKLLCFVLVMVFVIALSSTNCLAADIEYTDNVIPIMTNISANGIVSSNSIYSTDVRFQPYTAFDHDNSTLNGWSTQEGVIKSWLSYKFSDTKYITKYTIISRKVLQNQENLFVAQLPRDWTFEGWNEQTSTWDILDTRNNVTDWAYLTKKEFTFSNTKGYKEYRINVTSNNGASMTSIGELEMMETMSTAKLFVLLNEGETVQLSTSYNLDNNKNYTWSSTNEAVATVDANGKVTAVAEGTADIYAQNADGTFKEYIPVKVVKGIADELRLAVHLKAGEKAKLYLTDDASKVTWSSMDNTIATISTDGQITGVKKGLAIIQATLDGQTYQIYVRVNG